MVIAPSGTFDYRGIVSRNRRGDRWTMSLRQHASRDHDTRLVGLAPSLTVVNVGIPRDVPRSLPAVPMCELTIAAGDGEESPARKFVIFVDQGVIDGLLPGDEIQIRRSGNCSVGLGARRARALIFAVGEIASLELGPELTIVEAGPTSADGHRLSPADDDYWIVERPIVVSVGSETATLQSGVQSLDRYRVWLKHGARGGCPGTSACGAVYLQDYCSEATARAAAELVAGSGFIYQGEASCPTWPRSAQPCSQNRNIRVYVIVSPGRIG